MVDEKAIVPSNGQGRVKQLARVAEGGGYDLLTLGRLCAASGFFADARQEAQAVVKILAGAELGLGPIASMTGIYIVKGRVTLSANLIASAIRNHPRCDYRVLRLDETGCELEFLRDGKSEGKSSFSLEDAKRAKLGGENWTGYARNMLFARAMSNGAKWYCPEVFNGSPIYTPDELGAEVDGATGEVTRLPAAPEPMRERAAAGERHETYHAAAGVPKTIADLGREWKEFCAGLGIVTPAAFRAYTLATLETPERPAGKITGEELTECLRRVQDLDRFRKRAFALYAQAGGDTENGDEMRRHICNVTIRQVESRRHVAAPEWKAFGDKIQAQLEAEAEDGGDAPVTGGDPFGEDEA